MNHLQSPGLRRFRVGQFCLSQMLNNHYKTQEAAKEKRKLVLFIQTSCKPLANVTMGGDNN